MTAPRWIPGIRQHLPRIKPRMLWIALLPLLLLAGVAFLIWHIGTLVSGPAHQPVGSPPPELGAESVTIHTRDGLALGGWFAPDHAPSRGAVLLLHGLHSSRLSMLGRAEFLHRAGYAVLLVDLRAHGESQGDQVSFGYRESFDAQAAIAFLRDQLPGEPVAAIGSSLGGAALLLGPEPARVDAVVLEAVYPTIQQALANRLRMKLGAAGPALMPLLLPQLPMRLGVETDQLRPIDAIRRIACPIFIIAGDDDRRTLPAETRAVFAAAPEPKQLWLVPGARHENLHTFAPEAYEQKVLAFLAASLHNGAPEADR